MKVVFNTGRLYQSDGQVITAIHDAQTSQVIFMDHSRGIAGELNAGYPVPLEQRSFINFVMREYDANRYRMSMDAMQIRLDARVKPLPWRL